MSEFNTENVFEGTEQNSAAEAVSGSGGTTGGEVDGGERRLSRTLTQRYDMHSLRALQELEVVIYEELVKICGCSEDDLPVELDLLLIFNANAPDRNGLLSAMLTKAPGDNAVYITSIIERLVVIEKESSVAKAELEAKKSAKVV
mmetsp:Transcript_16535/g.15873  ORF Transcript_16535/g.15873 Transcript_16535/m.15873 type:complete len:145 (+) Transcript_16535:110-544(+)|eukprot:CAMPEP_0119044276 /NCGR_PEP_ID=MMETSP1177-20130426/30139_1 /TAXON_ID=2985 /ORGANISM="Ochromonas sp, Strain CCMP1899" /LENGTH=144 /DNA_ID=CAMNT_0007014125 /DNA_START=67 /DNA_END=501 /DNA_ORIENTATION=+